MQSGGFIMKIPLLFQVFRYCYFFPLLHGLSQSFESRSGCGQGASIAIMWHCESDDLIVSIKCKRGDVINVYLCGVSITNVA